jgi:hypothetical protein
MIIQKEREIYQKAARCFDLLNKSVQLFEGYLREASPQNAPDYYRARNYLRDGEAFFRETLNEARRLLGPAPAYTTPDFEKRRIQFLEENKILAKSQEFDDLKAELQMDENLKPFLQEEELENLLRTYYDIQQTGKRKLANIKIRILAAKIHSLLARAQDLQKEALKKHQ